MEHVFSGTTRECPVVAGAKWELVCDVPGSKLIEGVNMRNGELWFMDVLGSSFMRVEGGRAVTVLADPDFRMRPNGGRFIDGETMLVSDRGMGLCTLDVNTLEYKVVADSFEGERFRGLSDMVVDGEGGAYVTDAGEANYLDRSGAVYYVRYGDGSYAVERIATGMAWPNGITLSPDGLMAYVAEFHTNSVIAVPTRKMRFEWPHVFCRLDGGHGPDGMVSDAAGNVYVAHLGAKEVVVVNDAGWVIGRVPLPEEASANLSNLLIDGGYLYVTECGHGSIWRIPVAAEPNPITQ